MLVYGLHISSDKALTNFDLVKYVKLLKIKHFRGVFMRDSLPATEPPHQKECGIVNLNTADQAGSHWVCYFKDEDKRVYFDSFGQVTPIEIQRYLKTRSEFDKPVIQRNTDIVQRVNTHVCGHLCLYVLTALTREHLSYQDVLNKLNDGYSRGDW